MIMQQSQNIEGRPRPHLRYDDRLPCGCSAHVPDGLISPPHGQGCMMKRWRGGDNVVRRRRQAVVAMFMQLNELWYLARGTDVPRR